MKKIIIAFALLFSASSLAQIGEAEKKSESVTIGEVNLLEYGIIGDLNGLASLKKSDIENEDGKAYYMIAFQNQEYKTITDIKVNGFFADQEDLNYLFDEMVKVLKTGQEVEIMLGKRKITLSRLMGGKKGTLFYWADGDGHFYLSDQQLYLLFGKGNDWKKEEWDNKAWKSYEN